MAPLLRDCPDLVAKNQELVRLVTLEAKHSLVTLVLMKWFLKRVISLINRGVPDHPVTHLEILTTFSRGNSPVAYICLSPIVSQKPACVEKKKFPP